MLIYICFKPPFLLDHIPLQISLHSCIGYVAPYPLAINPCSKSPPSDGLIGDLIAPILQDLQHILIHTCTGKYRGAFIDLIGIHNDSHI